MKTLLRCCLWVYGCGWLLTLSAQAQTAPTMALLGTDPASTTYTGPRYPGGPDSLRATLRRVLRPANPTLAGQLFLHLELDEQGRTRKARLLRLPAGPAAALAVNPEVLVLTGKIVQTLLPWQLGEAVPGQPDNANSITLPLDFGPTATPPALDYSEENPTFPAQKIRGRSVPNLRAFVQMQVLYPAEDIRQRRQGVVYAYLEVSETGAVEQQRIAGSVSPTLDAEVLRVLATLPNALTPPRLHGQPVRVGYVLPFIFKVL
ncbi:MAG: energy transducer TonB [Hymenobacter sp.]